MESPGYPWTAHQYHLGGPSYTAFRFRPVGLEHHQLSLELRPDPHTDSAPAYRGSIRGQQTRYALRDYGLQSDYGTGINRAIYSLHFPGVQWPAGGEQHRRRELHRTDRRFWCRL